MSEDTKVKVRMPRKKAEALKQKGVIARLRRSHEMEIKLISGDKFFEKMSKPTESKLYNFMENLKTGTEEQMDTKGISRLIEYGPGGKWRWRIVRSSAEIRPLLEQADANYEAYIKLRESDLRNFMKNHEDNFGGGFADAGSGSLAVRQEYTPLIGSPFYKQMYLFDYWEMHSKCFWYMNYSGIGKMITDMTRNFVLGKGFAVDFKDAKAQKAWDAYLDRCDINEEARNWCNELTGFGETMIKKIPTKSGLIHKSFDPSTVWEIVTDPENITDIKYYHQQYNTQYQLFGDSKTPTSKYIINQLPPQMVIHKKVNVTAYEKRGRSDLLAALLYFKYYEDYIQAKLTRAKNEAAFIWDVSIDGSDEDVLAYINNTENITDVPPGSENVHNKAITRTPLSPQFSASGTDEIVKDILSYVAMATSIPVNYMGTFMTGGFTKAGSLVATEPVAKKMVERQLTMESIIRMIKKDVMVEAKLDPNTPCEVSFPEIMEEDRSGKIKDLVVAKDESAISHRTMSTIVAKELKITDYDYEAEQKQILKEQKQQMLDAGGGRPGTGDPANPDDNPKGKSGDLNLDADSGNRAFDRSQVKKDGLSI